MEFRLFKVTLGIVSGARTTKYKTYYLGCCGGTGLAAGHKLCVFYTDLLVAYFKYYANNYYCCDSQFVENKVKSKIGFLIWQLGINDINFNVDMKL